MLAAHMADTAPNPNAGKASDHLANERTYLAWIRTSISVIVFGFVVAKFGITLREFLQMRGGDERSSGMSLAIGAGFMVMGIFMSLLSCVRYQRTRTMLERGDFHPANRVVTALSIVAAAFGAILVSYIIYTNHTF
jgi:putative membrane protein